MARPGCRSTELGVVVSLDSLLARELLELRMESVTLVDTVSEDSKGWECDETPLPTPRRSPRESAASIRLPESFRLVRMESFLRIEEAEESLSIGGAS